MRKFCSLVLALALIPGVAKASLITNGGFETGNFTGWTQSGNTGFTFVTDEALGVHSGTYGAAFGPFDSLGYIEQTIATTAGETYQLSFWLQNLGGVPNEFEVAWDGTIVTSLTDAGSFGYTQFNYDLVASGSSTIVKFGFQNDPSFYTLDDVSVNAVTLAVPIPAGVVLAGMGIVCMVGFTCVQRRRTVLSA